MVDDRAATSSNGDIRGDVRAQIREFLSRRRAKVTSERAGLPVYGGHRRRVSGLRREEVASLAGISSEYYTRLERGNVTGVSGSVIEGIAHALQLDEAERTHLLDLLRTAGTTRRPRRQPARERVRPRCSASWIRCAARPGSCSTDAWTSGRQPSRARAVLAAIRRSGEAAQQTRFIFLDSRATEFFRDWNKIANDTVAMLRAEVGRDPYDRRLSDLIGELSTRSDEFRSRWAAHNVRIHSTGVKLIHHPVVGDLDLPFDSFPLAADPSQSLLTYTAEPGSPTQDALNLLASWAATTDDLDEAASADDTEEAESFGTAD